jgi:hypothetical protein
MMKKILLFFVIPFLILPILVSADITITDWKLTKGTVYEGEEVIFSVSVTSGNATTRVFADLIKTNSTNTTTSYVDLTLIGSSTRGSWIKFFKEKEGVYEINKITVIDNTSYNKTFLMRDYGFVGFRVLAPITTTTTSATTTSTTSQTTTTTPTAISTTTTIPITTTTTAQPSEKTLIQSILGNPLMLIFIVIAVVAIPIILFLFIPA